MTIAHEIGAGLSEAFDDRRHKMLRRLRREDRMRLASYARRAIIGALIGWILAMLYLIVTPVKYVSKWTLILPNAGQSATMSIETVGQATTTANSPFGSVSLSPKVVYREIADSDIVRSAAAQAVGMTYQEFGRPRVKLIDETALMLFEIGARTPEIAQKKAFASIKALNAQLEALRKDELEKRSAATTQNLRGYQEQVMIARARITETQTMSGLVSIAQFNELVATLSATRRRMTDLLGEVGKVQEEQAGLVSRIGMDPTNASVALRLASDPALARVVSEFAEANGVYTAQTHQLGPNNPVMINLDKKRSAARENLQRLVAKHDLGDETKSRALVLMMNVSHQAELLQQLVRNEASLQGKRRELETIVTEKERLEGEIARLSGAAAKLEDLKKDHLLAEAVYSSALARVDTTKSDIYGAYPIVQVLAPPNLPEGHEQPRRLYAFAGGVAGTLFSIFTWGLAWLHYLQTTRRRKKRSSTG
jgi:uncharacterized protein involved in exopolysaccharide biosynthesis